MEDGGQAVTSAFLVEKGVLAEKERRKEDICVSEEYEEEEGRPWQYVYSDLPDYVKEKLFYIGKKEGRKAGRKKEKEAEPQACRELLTCGIDSVLTRK